MSLLTRFTSPQRGRSSLRLMGDGMWTGQRNYSSNSSPISLYETHTHKKKPFFLPNFSSHTKKKKNDAPRAVVIHKFTLLTSRRDNATQHQQRTKPNIKNKTKLCVFVRTRHLQLLRERITPKGGGGWPLSNLNKKKNITLRRRHLLSSLSGVRANERERASGGAHKQNHPLACVMTKERVRWSKTVSLPLSKLLSLSHFASTLVRCFSQYSERQ